MFKNAVIWLVFSLFLSTLAVAMIIEIPLDYTNIQDGINSANDNDTILVHPGTYFENLMVIGKCLVIGSLYLTTGDSTFISETVIDGGNSGNVIRFYNVEEFYTGVIGLKIQNGQFSYGGGISCANANIEISRNIIFNNRTSNTGTPLGGAISCSSSDVYINQNKVFNNHATTTDGFAWGGAIYAINCNLEINRNLIFGNSVSAFFISAGGGIFIEDCDATIKNNTIFNNAVYITNPGQEYPELGGGIYAAEDAARIENNIIWGNVADSHNQIYTEAAIVNYCCVQFGFNGEGNIDSNPRLVNPYQGDFNLLSDSPCIDAGNPESPLDPDSTYADIGALYFNQFVDIEYTETKPALINIYQNYPNPFNNTTIIPFELEKPEDIRIGIYDILGRKVFGTVIYDCPKGINEIMVSTENLKSGIYLYEISLKEISLTKKLTLLK